MECRLDKRLWIAALGALTLGACDNSTPAADAGGIDAGTVTVAANPSRGSSIATDEAGTTLAVANKATDDITFFNLSDLTERARVSVGDEPVSVTFSPDGATLYVVNRASQSVSVVTGANTDAPTVSDNTIAVGSEPILAALSPTGATLYVSNWVDGTLSFIDTATATVTRTLSLGGAPYAVCVTNNGDTSDTDETIYVTDFYSRPIAGQQDATDRGRQARVFAVSAEEASFTSFVLNPINVTGIRADIDAANTAAFPNQLYSCTIAGDLLYVTAVGASPESFMGGTDFHQNVHGLVYAVNTSNNTVDARRTVNLSQLITLLPGEKRFAAVPHDIAFVPGTQFGYVAALSANALIRVDFSQSPPVAGSASGANFLATGFSPTGVAINGSNAYVYNEVGRSFSHVDLANQVTATTDIASAPQPPTRSAEENALVGQRFFNTGLARWSTGAWVACVSCHPMGTTDNVTWSFPAGPRQTVDTSATFNQAGDVQRILNWTAIFDETHDFELNTRGVAGGVGAIVSDPVLDVASRIDFAGANGFNLGSAAGAGSVLEDWDRIEDYIASIRSPHGATADGLEGDPAAGRTIFETANCANCHGGPLWTLSERYYTPVANGDLRLVTFGDRGITDLSGVRPDQAAVTAADIATTAIIANDANGAPQRHVCVVRNVATFDAIGAGGRGADEIRQNGTPAQGVDGFNVPSLLNIGMGAPYLHNGAADSLEDLLDPAGPFGLHLQAGNQVFAPTAQQVTDLIAFLRTIDDSTPTIDVPANQRLCPVGVVPPTP